MSKIRVDTGIRVIESRVARACWTRSAAVRRTALSSSVRARSAETSSTLLSVIQPNSAGDSSSRTTILTSAEVSMYQAKAQYRSASRIAASSRDNGGPTSGIGSCAMSRRGGRAAPAAIRRCNGDVGIGVNWATGRPRSVITTVSPAAASATTADAFCLSARMPTSDMCYIVVHSALSARDTFGVLSRDRAGLTRHVRPKPEHAQAYVSDSSQMSQ